MSIKFTQCALAATLAGSLLAGTAQAYEAGTWLGRVGIWGVYPKSDNLENVLNTGATVDVDDGYSLGFNITYMATPNIGIELLGAWPFEHDISLTGVGKIGSTKHLPPTLSVQYHFMPNNNIRPYVGVGLNYTFFFDEDTSLDLTNDGNTSLKLEDSWGLAGQLGVDIDVAPNWFVNVDFRYIDIDAKAKLDGIGIGTVNIDPFIFGINIGTRF